MRVVAGETRASLEDMPDDVYVIWYTDARLRRARKALDSINSAIGRHPHINKIIVDSAEFSDLSLEWISPYHGGESRRGTKMMIQGRPVVVRMKMIRG